MSYTRQDWARAFLAALGNRSPSQATVDWVVGWSVHETGTGGGATYNLLNTTQRAPGSTQFNGVGVQNFTSFSQGVQTNAIVLGQNFAGYAPLKQALLSNDLGSLGGPSAGVQQGLTTWCGGCGYGVGFQALGAVHRNDQFPGNSSGVSLAPLTSGGGSSSGGGGGFSPQIVTTTVTKKTTTGNGGGTITPATGGSTTATSGSNNNSSNSSGSNDPLGGLAQVLVWFLAPIEQIGNFFATAGEWLSNPVRTIKLVVGVGLIAIAIVAAVTGGLKAVGNSKAGKAALGAAKTAAKAAAV